MKHRVYEVDDNAEFMPGTIFLKSTAIIKIIARQSKKIPNILKNKHYFKKN